MQPKRCPENYHGTEEERLSLERFPGRGRPLDALIPVHTEYRYLVCENYCIFYLYSEEDVIIIRILHQRQDSLKALFMDN